MEIKEIDGEKYKVIRNPITIHNGEEFGGDIARLDKIDIEKIDIEIEQLKNKQEDLEETKKIITQE